MALIANQSGAVYLSLIFLAVLGHLTSIVITSLETAACRHMIFCKAANTSEDACVSMKRLLRVLV